MPWMLFWCCFWVVANEVMQNVKQGLHMLPVISALCSADVVNNHFENMFCAVFFIEHELTVGDCRYFRHVFMLGDGQHFFLGQVTKCEAVF